MSSVGQEIGLRGMKGISVGQEEELLDIKGILVGQKKGHFLVLERDFSSGLTLLLRAVNSSFLGFVLSSPLFVQVLKQSFDVQLVQMHSVLLLLVGC